MKLFNMTDLHGGLGYLETVRDELQAADLVIITGDITNFGGRAEAKRILDGVAAVNPVIFAVSGNCDRAGVEEYLRERNLDLHAQARRYGELGFVGLSGSLPGPMPTPNTTGEEELARFLSEVSINTGERFVLVSHQPPLDTVADMIARGRHVGSKSVREFIETKKPLLCLTGHIHESIGKGELGGCTVVNPGPFGQGRYALIEIDDGGAVRVELCGS